MELAIDESELIKDIHLKIQNQIDEKVKLKIEDCVRSSLSAQFGKKGSFDKMIKELLVEEFQKQFPHLIQEKIIELEKDLKEFSIDWGKDKSWNGEYVTKTTMNIKQAVVKRVNLYIENELIEEVNICKKTISDKFAKFLKKEIK